MYRFAQDDGIDLEELRARLRKMSDEQLLRFGKAGRFLCRAANHPAQSLSFSSKKPVPNGADGIPKSRMPRKQKSRIRSQMAFPANGSHTQRICSRH